ncbi:MAG TPA: MmcQ/YjbR family DNA-binding protein [Bryobacteraceae bacterium]|nr:MmcQ/YjbR family DNA-binding protein [Bryobacteraceae bacterium]
MNTSSATKQLARVRRICRALPETLEKLSHGEPTFFAGGKRVFAMFANNHHKDGHIAVWIPARPGLQQALIQDAPGTYFKPPYVGPSGWVGIELDRVTDDQLAAHVREAWLLVAPKKLKGSGRDKVLK